MSTGENRPIPLFSFCFLLSLGALACTLVRQWRVTMLIAAVASFILYIGWFIKFFIGTHPGLPGLAPPQMVVALIGLSLFYLFFSYRASGPGLVAQNKQSCRGCRAYSLGEPGRFCLCLDDSL